MTEKLWADGLPALSVLWLSEPDYAQHGSGAGSKTGKLALKSSDNLLAKVLAKLDEKGVREQTDVLVVSDHGFSTVTATVDVFKDLWAHKFDAGGAFVEKPEKGSIVVVGLGGAVFFYVVGNDPADVQKLVDHLQTRQWAGVIFTKNGLEGTFKHADAGIDSPDAPDVVVSMRWADQNFKDRMPGALLAEGNRTIGAGTHGSLSKYDMTNTLIAAGPDFKSGFVNHTPSGNPDVAPTVLRLLGLDNPALDGRVLEEALVGGGETPSETTTLEARRTLAGKTWRQYLKVSKVGNRSYLDEGNGAVEK
jgi:arylsulfatase A-like enzyme